MDIYFWIDMAVGVVGTFIIVTAFTALVITHS